VEAKDELNVYEAEVAFEALLAYDELRTNDVVVAKDELRV